MTATDNDADPGTTGTVPDGDDPMAAERSARPWLDAITDAQKYFQYWQDKADKIDQMYADLKELAEGGTEREFQMFWANLEVLKPSIYSRAPQPVVVPRFKDMKELPRKASEMLERCLNVNFEQEDVNATMLQVRDDMATNGRGAAWVRLKDYDGVTRSCIEHVDRGDFLHEPARKWKEVGWVARRSWLGREEGLKRFGDGFLNANLKSRKELNTNDNDQTDYQGEKKAEVWEIWSKSRRIVVWVTPGLDEVLDIREPFLQLEGFYPCPQPAYATTERRKLIPVPDFVYYKDQLEEINELTARISALAESLRVRAIIPGGSGDLAEALEKALTETDNRRITIPIPGFAGLGGVALKDSIVYLPLEEIANTITACVALRRQLIEDVYQITGISDIMRGDTNPDETLGAQELKSQYGSIRIRDRQAELVRFARDLTRISGEIIAENYPPEQLQAMAQMDLPTDQMIQQQVQQIVQQAQQAAMSPQVQAMAQQAPDQLQQLKQQVEQQIQQLQQTITLEQVSAFLREQRTRPYILEIETDSTIQVDEDAEKQRRTEFLTALGTVMTQLGPLIAQQPAAAPFAVETLKFAVAPFRAGRSLEGAIEQFAEAIKGQAQQQMENPAPSPEQVKVQQDDKKLALEAKKHKDEMQLRQQEMAMQQQQGERSHELETRKARVDGDKGEPSADGQPAQPAYSMAEVIEQLAQQNAQIVQALAQMAQAIAAPKSVTTPEGRTYTTQSMTVN